MRYKTIALKAMLVLLIAAFANPIQAGPSCSVRPNHPNCESSGEDPGPVYKVTFSNIVTGTVEEPGIYTTPGTLNGDESGLGANSNGPNVVEFILYDFLSAALGTEQITSCFPPNWRLSGSIQMQDNSSSGGDVNRVGYIWANAYDINGDEMPYTIDLFDMTGLWSVPLLPESTSTRTVTHWKLSRSKKKNVPECVSDGLVDVTGENFTVTVEKVDANPWYP